jgi:hypothetical protein
MFVKKIDKSNPKKGRVYFTYRLCESYRIDNKVRHRSILNLGNLGDVYSVNSDPFLNTKGTKLFTKGTSIIV